ncbi:MAG: hypothetical protein ACUVTG_15315 [Candidatus Oleimicrobiaceae bacterium]
MVRGLGTLIVLVVRTRGGFPLSHWPGRARLITTLSPVAATLAIPFPLVGTVFRVRSAFADLPRADGAELVKRWFYRLKRYG